MKRLMFVLIMMLACKVPRAELVPKQIFITANGVPAGACQNEVRTPDWFNDPGNWGPGSGQIGPGTTVLICGAFVDSTPGDFLLRAGGSGTSGNPITLLFDTNASLTNTAYWGQAALSAGAIYIGSNSWIVVDGGTNGLIQNTGNGTGLAYEHASTGIGVMGGTNIVIKNMTIANICQHMLFSDSAGCVTSGTSDSAISLIGGNHITVQNNTIHDTQTGIYMNADPVAVNLLVTGNTFFRCNWGVGIGIAVSGTASAITISKNDISDPYNWDSAADTFHHNGIMVFDSASLANSFSGVIETANYIHGDFGLNNTAWIFNDDNSGLMSGFYIFNNALINGNPAHKVNNCYITGYGSHSFILNNTVVGPGIGICSTLSAPFSGLSGTMENNLLSTETAFVSVVSPITAIDYNQYMSLTQAGCVPYLWGGGPCYGQSTFAAWKTACGCDVHSAYHTANSVNANGTLQARSPAIKTGVNLTSLGIAGLNVDANGVARPATGAWDVGAYQTSPPPPPTNLHGVVR